MKRKLAYFYTPQPAKLENTNPETAKLTVLASTEITTPTGTILDPTMTDEGAIKNDIGNVIGQTAELSDHDFTRGRRILIRERNCAPSNAATAF